jgi:D-alanyl-D-alanine carboxypeptidase
MSAHAAHAAQPVASPYVVVDVDSGAVLASRGADQRWYPASLTELMSAYVIFSQLAQGKLAPDAKVTESANAAAQEPVKMGFPVGTTMNIENALKMMIVPSANDIAVALAEATSGSTAGFVGAMNDTATAIGMNQTHFANPNGLPDDSQTSTARDLAVLARHVWLDFPDRHALFAIEAIRSGNSVYHSPNLALLERYSGTEGLKTGFTCAAGYNGIAIAARDGHTLLAVVLGRTSATDRAEFTAALLDRSFESLDVLPSPPAPLVADVTDPGSDAGPVNMGICQGTGVDRAGFGNSPLGPVVAVTHPVDVTVDRSATAAVASSDGSSSSSRTSSQGSTPAKSVTGTSSPKTTSAKPTAVANAGSSAQPGAKAATAGTSARTSGSSSKGATANVSAKANVASSATRRATGAAKPASSTATTRGSDAPRPAAQSADRNSAVASNTSRNAARTNQTSLQLPSDTAPLRIARPDDRKYILGPDDT